MKKQICRALLFLLVCALNGAHAGTQSDDTPEKLSPAAVAASAARTKEIRRELRNLRSHDWAGEYYFGDGLGVNVSLASAPEGGFVFSWQGCLGLYDLNYGDVSFSDGKINLLPKYPNTRNGFEGMATELLPVHWGERHYLIPADHVVEFTNAINAGTEPSSLFGGRSGRFLLRRGDEKKTVNGQPSIPDQYLAYLLPEPIKSKISSVEQTIVQQSRRITSVKLDVGSAEGLKQGMELFVHRPSRVYDTAIVTAVSEHSAQAVIEQMELTDPVPSAGWELSTKL